MADFSIAPDYFDSRDVIERIAELEQDDDLYTTEDGVIVWNDEDTEEEYEALTALRDEAEGNVADWEYGETFISEEAFEEYARELLQQIGYVSPNMPEWIVIDWEETANNLKVDYHEFSFRGETYYAR